VNSTHINVDTADAMMADTLRLCKRAMAWLSHYRTCRKTIGCKDEAWLLVFAMGTTRTEMLH